MTGALAEDVNDPALRAHHVRQLRPEFLRTSPQRTIEGQPARPLWSSVRVLQIDSVKGVAGSTARRQVTIALASTDLPRIPAALTAISAGEPTLVRKDG